MMLTQHATRQLEAYCRGKLDAEAAQRVKSHLERCRKCREEYELIVQGSEWMERLPQNAAPEGLWQKIEASLDTAIAPSPRRFPFTFKAGLRRSPLPFRTGLAYAPIGAALILLIGFAWVRSRMGPPPPSFGVVRIAGEPQIGSSRIDKAGKLPVGGWLTTDEKSKAQIRVADIGQVVVGPNSQVRLVETGKKAHKLSLAKGELSAKIKAPPRLFFVETPSAVAVDLGCAYELTVDDAKRSLLRVTAGWVLFEWNGKESIVPAGAACRTRPAHGPGTPYFEDSSEALKESLEQIDFSNSEGTALDTVLKQARARDSLTLWHLLNRVNYKQRGRVYDRLAALVPPPTGVTRDGVLRLHSGSLALWRAKMETTWLGFPEGLFNPFSMKDE